MTGTGILLLLAFVAVWGGNSSNSDRSILLVTTRRLCALHVGDIMTQGYPPGTKCVLTWALSVKYVGQIVEVIDAAVFPASVTGHPAQLVTFVDAPEQVYNQPIDWMRPIDEDTDEDDQEVIRQMNTIRVRDRVTKLDPAWGEGAEK